MSNVVVQQRSTKVWFNVTCSPLPPSVAAPSMLKKKQTAEFQLRSNCSFPEWTIITVTYQTCGWYQKAESHSPQLLIEQSCSRKVEDESSLLSLQPVQEYTSLVYSLEYPVMLTLLWYTLCCNVEILTFSTAEIINTRVK